MQKMQAVFYEQGHLSVAYDASLHAVKMQPDTV